MGQYLDGVIMDDLLRQLRHSPPAEFLDALDDRVLGALAERGRDVTRVRRMTAFAAFLSLGSGAFAGALTGEPVAAARPLSPLTPMNALAPSVLLDAR